MSASLERIIRPAQTAGIRPTNFAVARAAPASGEEALITWGGPGATVFELKAHIKEDTKPLDEKQETERTFDVVKIKNPDDDTQFIQTEVMTAYQARNKIDGSRIKLFYEPQQAAPNIEIVSTGNIRKS